MSVRGVGTLAALREDPGSAGDPVRKADIGKAPPNDTAVATALDTLVQVVPTGIIAGYSAILAYIIGAIAAPTKADLHPDQLLGLRVGLWVVFLLLSFGLAISSYHSQAKKATRKVPMEVWVSTLAFAVWALGSPGTWFAEVVSLKNDKLEAGVPVAVVIIGTLILSMMSSRLRTKLEPKKDDE